MTRAYFKRIEEAYLLKGYNCVVGVDEVGRGPLSGPLVVGAYVYSEGLLRICGLNDSKKLSEKKRVKLVDKLVGTSTFALGIVSAGEIDEIGLTKSTNLAISRALRMLDLDSVNTIVLLDGNYKYQTLGLECETFVKGDSKVRVIAAASNLAKVYRDNIMSLYDSLYAGYNWSANAGYGTKQHREAILKYGVSPIHRYTFLQKMNGS